MVAWLGGIRQPREFKSPAVSEKTGDSELPPVMSAV
jgi:hypothetical protein